MSNEEQCQISEANILPVINMNTLYEPMVLFILRNCLQMPCRSMTAVAEKMHTPTKERCNRVIGNSEEGGKIVATYVFSLLIPDPGTTCMIPDPPFWSLISHLWYSIPHIFERGLQSQIKTAKAKFEFTEQGGALCEESMDMFWNNTFNLFLSLFKLTN